MPTPFKPEEPDMRLPLLAATLAAVLSAAAGADELRLYRADEAVDPRDVARILGVPSQTFKTRSLRLLDDASPVVAAAAPAEAMPAAVLPPTPTPTPTPAARRASLALPVQFGFASAEILPAARGQLDALAEGIRLLSPTASVVIEGHTDAQGGETYNETLSQRRAQAVKQYLVALHGISAARLRTLGHGEYATLPGRDPYAAENRRVQFRGE
jgi:OOP family OmpA-OmpF porin